MKTTTIKSSQFFKPVYQAVKNGGEISPSPSPIPSEDLAELKAKVTANTVAIEEVGDRVTQVSTAAQQASDKADAADQRVSNAEASLSTISGDVATNKADINQVKIDASETAANLSNVSNKADKNATDVAALTAVVSQNQETIENEVAAVSTRVTTLENSIDAKIDAKVAGAFKFRGAVDSLDEIEDADRHEGDVWQVGEKEYAYNGTEFVELGFAVDLSAYATAESVADVADQVASKASAERVAEIAAAVENKADKSDIPDLTELENSVTTINSTLETKANKVEVDAALADKATKTELTDEISAVTNTLNNKVDAVEGKQLSDQNFTAAEKEKLASLENYDDSNLNTAITKINSDINDLSSSVDAKFALHATKDYVNLELEKKANASDFEAHTAESAAKIANLEAAVESLNNLTQALQQTVVEQAEMIKQLQASVNKTTYVYNDPEADVAIESPLYNQVNVVANNVAINNNITAEEETPANTNGIDITAADKVTIGE